jgi:hypothetical protein
MSCRTSWARSHSTRAFGHYEIEGVISTFRDRYFPNAGDSTPSASGATNLTTTVAVWAPALAGRCLHKKVDIGGKVLAGAGIERYGSSTLPEVIVKPSGALEPLRGGSSLATLELHPGSRLDLYGNFGVDYAERTLYSIGGTEYGYGSPNQKTYGCQTECCPPQAAKRRQRHRADFTGQLHGGQPRYRRVDGGLLVPLLQGIQGHVAAGHAVLL